MRAAGREAARVMAMGIGATVSAAAMWVAGRSVLPTPPVLHPGMLPHWWSELGPVAAVFAAARVVLGTLATAWALLLLAVAAVRVLAVLGGAGSGAWRWIAGCGTSGGSARAARLVRLLLGLSASGGVVAGCGTSGAAGPAPSGPAPSGPAPSVRAPSVPPPLLVGPPVELGSAGPAGVGLPTPAADVARSRAPAPARAPAWAPRPSVQRRAPAPAVWTVRPGDDFWSIAEAVLSGEEHRPVTVATIATYWARLIDANRDRLPVPGHPDLLFPGDMLVLPPPSGAAG